MYRIDRLNGEMQKAISGIISGKLRDPRISEMVTVTGVEVAKDLKTAKVYVSVYDKKETTLCALSRAAGFIRRELAAEFSALRTVPALEFRADESIDYGAKIDKVLEEIKKSDAD